MNNQTNLIAQAAKEQYFVTNHPDAGAFDTMVESECATLDDMTIYEISQLNDIPLEVFAPLLEAIENIAMHRVANAVKQYELGGSLQ